VFDIFQSHTDASSRSKMSNEGISAEGWYTEKPSYITDGKSFNHSKLHCLFSQFNIPESPQVKLFLFQTVQTNHNEVLLVCHYRSRRYRLCRVPPPCPKEAYAEVYAGVQRLSLQGRIHRARCRWLLRARTGVHSRELYAYAYPGSRPYSGYADSRPFAGSSYVGSCCCAGHALSLLQWLLRYHIWVLYPRQWCLLGPSQRCVPRRHHCVHSRGPYADAGSRPYPGYTNSPLQWLLRHHVRVLYSRQWCLLGPYQWCVPHRHHSLLG
jgi:hypothetical protein